MEPDLVIRAQHGDEAAYASIADAIADPFLAVARRILRYLDLAEDATQQALLSIWQDLPQLHDPAPFDAWSYRLLVRACYAESRRQRRWSPNLRLLPVDEADATDDPYVLTPSDGYDTSMTTFDDGGLDAISLWARQVPATLETCRAVSVQGVGDSPAELVAWLRSNKALTVGPSQDITVDGHPGKWVDVAIAPGQPELCGPHHVVTPLITSSHSADQVFPGLGGPQPGTARLFLLDVDGETLWIVVAAADPARQAALVDVAMPIVESMRLAPTS